MSRLSAVRVLSAVPALLLVACMGDPAPTPTALPEKFTTSVAAAGGTTANMVETNSPNLPRVSGFRAVAGRSQHTLSWNAIGETEYRVTIDGQSVMRKVDGYLITYGGRSALDSDGNCTTKCDEAQIPRSEGRTSQRIDQKGDTTFAVIQAFVSAKQPQRGRPSSTLRIVRPQSADSPAEAPRWIDVGDRVGAAAHLDSVPYAHVHVSFENRGWTKETQWRRGSGEWQDLSGERCHRSLCTLDIEYGSGTAQINPGQQYTFRTRQSRSDTNKSAWLTSQPFEGLGAPTAPLDLTASKSDSDLRLAWLVEGARDGKSDLPIMYIDASKSSSRTGTATFVDSVISVMDSTGASSSTRRVAWMAPQSIDLPLSGLGAGSHWLHATTHSVNGIEGGTSSIQVRIDVNAGDTTVTTIDSTHTNTRTDTPPGTDPNAFRPCRGGARQPTDCYPPGLPVLDTVTITETSTSAGASATWVNPDYTGARVRYNNEFVAASITGIDKSYEAVSNTGTTARGSGSSFSDTFSSEITQWTVTFRARAWNDNPGLHNNAYRRGPEAAEVVYLYRPTTTPTPSTPSRPSSVSTTLDGDSVIVTWDAVAGIPSDTSTFALYEDIDGTQYKVGAFDDRRVARPVEWYQDTVAVRLRFGVASVLYGHPDLESDTRWSSYVTVPAATSTTTTPSNTPAPTGLTAVAGWSYDGTERAYVRALRVNWTRGGDYGCTNYELHGKESSTSDFVLLSARSSCGGALDYQEDVKRMENAILLKAGTAYSFHVVAEYLREGTLTRVQSSEVSGTTCSSSDGVPAESGNGNPFRNCDGTER